MRLQKLSNDTLDDYLTEIYRLQEENGLVATSEIANRLNVSTPTATSMVKKLGEKGLVNHQKYRGVTITDFGRKRALKTLRRHRLAEKLLYDALGVDWEIVHREAHRLEHALSDQVIEKMAEFLGEPEFCPHGSPIPSKDGTVPERRGIPLWDLESETTAEVTYIENEDSDTLRRLGKIGLFPGTRVRVDDKTIHDEGVTITLGSQREFLGKTEAQSVHATEVA